MDGVYMINGGKYNSLQCTFKSKKGEDRSIVTLASGESVSVYNKFLVRPSSQKDVSSKAEDSSPVAGTPAVAPPKKHQRRTRDKYIYVLAVHDSAAERVKIGQATDPYKRYKQALTMNPDVYLAASFRVPDKRAAVNIEKQIHDKLLDVRVTKEATAGKEWFSIDAFSAINTVIYFLYQ